MLPGVCWLLAHVDKAFVAGWEGSTIGPEPVQVVEAKAHFLAEKRSPDTDAFMKGVRETTDYREATTEAQMQGAWAKHVRGHMSRAEALVVLQTCLMARPSVVAGFAKRRAKPGATTCCLKRDLIRDRGLCGVVLRWWAKLECLGFVCGGVVRHIAKYGLTQLVCIAAGVFA